MPQAWFMHEVLKKHGFAGARREALARTCAMVRQDGRIMEKFNSATGAGLGKTQQGWTAAIFRNGIFGGKLPRMIPFTP